MLRTSFSTLAASLLLLTACGDNGGTPTTSGATENATTEAGTTALDPGTTTGNPNPTTPTTTIEPGTTTDDTTGPGELTSSTTVEPGTTTIEPSTTTTDTEGTTIVPETSTTGDGLQNCLNMVEPDDECGQCACMNCLENLQQCQMDEGCTAIRMCAQESGCVGLACLGACGDVINEYGGLAGPSAMMALDLSGCVEDECPGLCG